MCYNDNDYQLKSSYIDKEVFIIKILERIETFIVLSESTSFTEAAKKLYCTQPTISYHVRHLEEMFGVKLVSRSKNSIQLTKQGEVLLQYAKQMKGLLEEATDKVKRTEEKEYTFSLYMSRYLADYLFSPQLDRFRQLIKQKSFQLNSYCYGDLKSYLQKGQTDFALMPIYEEDKEIIDHFDITYLFEDEFVLILPPNHSLQGRKILYSRDFSNETILLPQSNFLKKHIKDQLRIKKIHATYSQMSNFEMVKMAVKSGYGLAFLPYNTVSEELAMGTLRTIQVASLTLKRKNGLVMRRGIQLPGWKREICQEIVGTLQHNIKENNFSREVTNFI